MSNMQEIADRAKNLPPVDENVKLPAAIRAAAARSTEIHKAAYEQAPAPVEEVKPNGENGEQEKADAEAKAAEEERQKNNKAPATPDDWEHRYNSMKGRFESSTNTITQLNQRIANLEGLLSRANAAPRPVATPPAELTFKGITAEERETYGEEFIDVATRAAQEKLSPELVRLQRQVEELTGRLGGVAERTQQTTEATTRQYLTDNLPNWREINRDPKFIAWANLPDLYSGAIRLNMLNDAFSKGDGSRVLAFFKGFLSDEAATAPAEEQNSRTAPAPSGKVPLENFAAPGRAKAPAASTPPGEKETITTAQIAAFYANVQKGVYKGNDAEKNRLEKMIFDAQAEGRVA